MLLLKHSTAVLCAVFIITGAVSGEEVKKAVGDTVSFSPAKLGSVTSFTWKQINGVMVVKAIEWDIDDGFNTPNPRFQNITTIDKETGQITITNLKVEHSGIYTIDINSKEQQQRFSLTVMERVPKPVITIENNSNPDVAYLRCGYSETIIWKNSAGDTLEGKKNHNPGEFIPVKNTRNPGKFYTCTLKNDVSEETSDPVSEGEIYGTDSGPWWIALIVIPIMLVAAFILPYKFSGRFHAFVSKKCKDKPCIGALLNCLDGKEKDPPKSSSDVEKGEGIRENAALLKSSSDAENGGNTETDPPKSPSDVEKGEGIRENAALLKSPSPAENGGNTETDPPKSSSDVEKGEGIRENADPPKSSSDAENGGNTETDPLTPAENGEELPEADRDGGDKEDHL